MNEHSQVKDQVVEILFLDAVVQSDDVRVLQLPADPGLPLQLLKVCIRNRYKKLLFDDEFRIMFAHSSPPYRVMLTFWCLLFSRQTLIPLTFAHIALRWRRRPWKLKFAYSVNYFPVAPIIPPPPPASINPPHSPSASFHLSLIG